MQFETLQKDMIAAMKARDKVRKDAISTLVSAAKKAAIDEGCRDDIKEELVNRVILKEMKSVKEQRRLHPTGSFFLTLSVLFPACKISKGRYPPTQTGSHSAHTAATSTGSTDGTVPIWNGCGPQ